MCLLQQRTTISVPGEGLGPLHLRPRQGTHPSLWWIMSMIVDISWKVMPGSHARTQRLHQSSLTVYNWSADKWMNVARGVTKSGPF